MREVGRIVSKKSKLERTDSICIIWLKQELTASLLSFVNVEFSVIKKTPRVDIEFRRTLIYTYSEQIVL